MRQNTQENYFFHFIYFLFASGVEKRGAEAKVTQTREGSNSGGDENENKGPEHWAAPQVPEGAPDYNASGVV